MLVCNAVIFCPEVIVNKCDLVYRGNMRVHEYKVFWSDVTVQIIYPECTDVNGVCVIYYSLRNIALFITNGVWYYPLQPESVLCADRFHVCLYYCYYLALRFYLSPRETGSYCSLLFPVLLYFPKWLFYIFGILVSASSHCYPFNVLSKFIFIQYSFQFVTSDQTTVFSDRRSVFISFAKPHEVFLWAYQTKRLNLLYVATK